MKTRVFFFAAGFFALLASQTALSHCQIPCGIYGDRTRFTLLREHVQTIEKSMLKIVDLEQAEKLNGNQLTRWVNTKDEHADELTRIITYYFLTQRVTPVPDGDSQERKDYLKKLELLHTIMVESMKSKQTTDTAHTQALMSLINDFEKLYFGETPDHDHDHDGHTH
ncbi:MAG: superoxide dismutase [Ni] [Lentisphaeria bacterium]|nr:superoxide dismutase [Ni] [Lentisphaeria bacterium]